MGYRAGKGAVVRRAILAIDQGTTGSRAIVYDCAGKKIAHAYCEFPQLFPRPGWVEHDPAALWHSVQACLHKVLAQVPVSSIAAIGITNQRETIMVWDRFRGRPLHNAIVWQCRRTAERCAQLRRRPGFERLVRARTGLPLDPYFSATKIEWIMRHVQGVASRARAGELCAGTSDSWVLWNITAGAVHATDHTNASRTMLYDIGARDWDPVLLNAFGVPRAMLPHVGASSGLFGVSARCGRLAAGIPVMGIAGDQQAALFGQGCVAPGDIKNTYGTGSFILRNTGTRRVNSRSGLITTLACGAKGEPVFAQEGSVFIAGAAVQWLRDGLGIIARSRDSEACAASILDNEGVYFVPALVGLGAPHWDAQARGLVCGITRGTTRAHLCRAALEAICYQTRDVLEAMRRDEKTPVSRLAVDGGASANDWLCQFQADILGVRVWRPRDVESTCRGAAFLAGLGAGVWKTSASFRAMVSQGKEFIPRMHRAQAQALYKGWLRALKRTLG
jgi:glycerol kinase